MALNERGAAVGQRTTYECDHCGKECAADLYRFYVTATREKRSFRMLIASPERSGYLCEECGRTPTVANAHEVLG